MARQVHLSRQANKYLSRMPKPKALKMAKAFQQIACGNEEGLNIKYFTNQGIYRLRQGGIRAMYELVGKDLMLVVRIRPRGDIYK